MTRKRQGKKLRILHGFEASCLLYHPAYAQCLDHQMLMCRGCDSRLHGVTSQHQKQVVSSYLGCPSAEDFAAFWGFELKNIPGESCSQVGCISKALKLSCSTFISAADSGLTSSSQQTKLWSQNMQDLGICEDTISYENFNIPDVDATFRNFEELFGGDQDAIRALLDDNVASCSSVAKNMSYEKSNGGNARARESLVGRVVNVLKRMKVDRCWRKQASADEKKEHVRK